MVPIINTQAFKQWLPLVSDRWLVNQRYDLFFIGSCGFTLFFWGLYQVADQFHFFLQGDSILIPIFYFLHCSIILIFFKLFRVLMAIASSLSDITLFILWGWEA
jgi:hypothetical protein